ncbi:MAG: ABC-type transport auxiliary lipoprotein family protein [Rhizobiaceae bacterium]
MTGLKLKAHRQTFCLRRLAVVLTLFVAGCSSLGGSNKALDTYDLSVPTVAEASRRQTSVQVLIAEPQALKILDSENIVIRQSAASVAYLEGSQWSDRLPKIVQTRLVQAFENSKRFGGVGRPGEGLAIDYQVLTDIRAFEIDTGSGKRAVVEISAKLLNDRNGVVASTRMFEASVAATSGGAGFVVALDAAFDKVAAEMVAWVSKNI